MPSHKDKDKDNDKNKNKIAADAKTVNVAKVSNKLSKKSLHISQFLARDSKNTKLKTKQIKKTKQNNSETTLNTTR